MYNKIEKRYIKMEECTIKLKGDIKPEEYIIVKLEGGTIKWKKIQQQDT